MVFLVLTEIIIQQTFRDEYYRRQNLTNDSFYFGLEQTIEQRQREKIPIAGQSGYEFFTALGDVTFFVGRALGNPFVAATGKGIRAVGEWTLGYNPEIERREI